MAIAITDGWNVNGHTLALKDDGTVWAWGSNYYGELGDGSTENRLTAVPVKSSDGTGYLTGITAISTGKEFSVARQQDGSLWEWGNNSYGQLGIGANDFFVHNLPLHVKDANSRTLTKIQAIDAGEAFVIALNSDGTVYSWGLNSMVNWVTAHY